jgi:prepilin-type N-terminal cleavage/methylation domain-containing protein
MIRRTATRNDVGDEGFTLIEIVVSMFILAVLAVSLLPLLINGVNQSAQSAAVASATQLVNAQLSDARAQTSTCSAIAAAPSPTVGTASTYRGVPLKLTYTVGTCPTSPTTTSPGTISVTATVTRTDTNATLATATTLIYVTGT